MTIGVQKYKMICLNLLTKKFHHRLENWALIYLRIFLCTFPRSSRYVFLVIIPCEKRHRIELKNNNNNNNK